MELSLFPCIEVPEPFGSAMKRQCLNIVYQPGDRTPVENAGFLALWKVDADESYEASHPRGLSDPGIFIVHDGRGILTTRHKGFPREHVLSPSTFFLLDSGIPCRYRCAGNEGWRFHFIHFKSLSFPSGIGLEAGTVYPFMEENGIHLLCESIIAEIIHREAGYGRLIDSLFTRLLVELARQQAQDTGRAHGSIMKAIHWIHGNYDKHIDIEKLVRISSLARSVFFREFKKETGCTPHEFIMRVKLDAARLMLKSTSLRFTEIAHALGFYDEFHFSKAFKKMYSISPSSCRSGTGPRHL